MRLPGECLTLNIGECPNEERESFLWQILEEEVDGKYYLSPRACAGVLRRAEQRGVPLPTQLKEALSSTVRRGGAMGMMVGENVTPTLTTGCSRFAHYTEGVTVNLGSQGDRIEVNAKVSNTLSANGGGGSAKTGLYCLAGNTVGREAENGGNGRGFKEDVAYTLTAMDRHAVTYSLDYAAYNQGKNAQYKPEISNSGIAPTAVAKGPSLVAEPKTQYAVRRLTPKECERLQGFPDGWTDIGSDTARYKALGNSVAVPCVEFIMEGIKNDFKG